MRFKKRREAFRAILEGERCVHPASVFDPISARIAEDLGFETGMFAGSVASLTVLGAPDHIVITMSEFAEQCRRICRAGELPLMVDADHGYGNALNVMRTVEELEVSGICGMSIEDTVLPMVFGAAREVEFTSVEEGAGKMNAALKARRDSGLVIAWRTSAMWKSSIDDAVQRITAYEKCGVDAIFLVGVKTKEQLEAASSAVKLPLILVGAGVEIMDLDYLAANRVRLCLQGHQPIAAGYAAVHETMKALREGTKPASLQGLPSSELTGAVKRAGDYERWIDEYLSAIMET
ncbi:MAG: isocitrate lyase/PEP mutase family protein [Alphaproteobacteria bacterium]